MSQVICVMCALLLLIGPAKAAGPSEGGKPGAAAGGDQKEHRRVRMRVSPMVTQAPALVRIEMLIDPDSESRLLDVTIESADYFRGSSIPLEGDRAKRFHSIVYRSIPPGQYVVAILLKDPSGDVQGSDHARLEVLP